MTSRIRDLAAVRTGYQFRGKIEPPIDREQATHRVIQVKDFDDQGRLRTETLDPVTPKRDVASFLVREGDVLFVARGSSPFAAAITEPLPDTIVPSLFFLVRPELGRVRPRYLAWAINVSLRERLGALQQGTHVPQVSITDFGDLTIDVPPLDVQERIVALDDLGRREYRLALDIAERRADMVRRVCIEAARRGRIDTGDQA
jgi:hypothetical protein